MIRLPEKKVAKAPEKDTKKFLQACDGSSMYGRGSLVQKQNRGNAPKPGGEDIGPSYRDFYRYQVDAISKVFRKGTG